MMMMHERKRNSFVVSLAMVDEKILCFLFVFLFGVEDTLR